MDKRYWVGVASEEHVARGVELGISQFCHGKRAPAKHPDKGDFLIYYSPKHRFKGTEPCQKFTAIGRIIDDAPYQVEMEPGFKPYRRNVEYFKADPDDIRPLIEQLPFIQNKERWGYVFRYGFLKIDRASFLIIAQAMLEASELANHLKN